MAVDRTLPATAAAIAAAAIGLAGFAWLYLDGGAGRPSPALSQAESLAARPSAPMPLATVPGTRSRDNAPPGEIAPSRNAIDFGEVAPGGTATADLTVTARNAAMTIDRIDLSSPDPALRVSSTCRNPDGTAGPIPAGGNCTVTLAWTPGAPETLTRDLTVQGTTSLSDGTPRPLTLTVPLSGRARATPETGRTQIPAPPAAPPRNPLRDAIAQAIAQPLAPMAAPPGPAPGAGPLDPDWTGIGWERDTASKPVDLTRVISVEQVIPAVLERPIDSRFPSRANATVERPVYAARGNAVILQRGDHLIGRTASLGGGGEKVAILWDRVIRQDGTAWAIEGIAGDAMGRSGAIGRIDSRFFERFGSAIAGSLISVAGTLAIGGDEEATGGGRDGDGGSVARDARARAGNQFVQDSREIIRRMLEESIDVKPIVEIPAGTRLTVFPSTDLWLRPADGEPPPPVAAPPAPSIAPRGLYPASTRPGQQAPDGGLAASEPAWLDPDPLSRAPPGPAPIRPPADAGRAPWSTP